LLQFHWANQLEGKSSWARVAFPYTGSSRGMLFIPEVDDQVLISYEANHVDFPVVIGSLYHKAQDTDYQSENNYQKFIRTKGGNKIVFKDKPGKQEIFITNANKKGTNLHISFDGDGVITLKTAGLIQLEAKDIKMTAKNNIEMTAVNELSIKAMNLNTTASQKASHKATQAIELQGGAKVEIKGAQIDAQGGKVAIQGGMVEIQGGLVKIN